jgi:DNA-binding GntR family transcriptional regulator
MKDLGHVHSNLGDLVAVEIRAAILSGDLPPGSRLMQERLAADLNVSRIPVREALRTLESEGLVENDPGRGSRVVEVTPQRAADVLAVRGTLEGLAARLATGRVAKENIESLRSIVREGREATERADQAAANEAHTRFHLELARASGNSYLYEEFEAMPAKTEWIVSTLLKQRGPISWNEHEAIVDAVAEGKADLAEELTRHHSDEVIASLLDQDALKAQPETGAAGTT